MNLINYIYCFLVAISSSLVMVPLLRRWALERGEVDHPDARKLHDEPVPRIGGVAIYLSFLFSCLLFIKFTPQLRGILAGGLVVFVAGLIDDLVGLRPRWKFLAELVGVLVAILVGDLYITHLGDLFGTGTIILPLWLAIPFTLFAVTGVVNAINLIDGLDGLAGGVSMIALVGMFVLAFLAGNTQVMALCAALFGSLLGFLKYNFYPARIFMGDVGALSIGFLLAFFAILLTQPPATGTSPVLPLILLGVPISDTLWVMFRRLLRRKHPFSPDRTHVHHHFLDLGFQHRFTVIIIYGLSLFWGAFALFFHNTPDSLLLLSFLLVSVLFYLLLRTLAGLGQRWWPLQRDSMHGIRCSATYRRLANVADYAIVGLSTLLVMYLLSLVILSPSRAMVSWQPHLGFFCLSAGLFATIRDPRNPFLQSILFLAGMSLIAGGRGVDHLDWTGAEQTGIPDRLLLGIGALAAFKFIFRKDGDFFISSADYLVLPMAILFALASSRIEALHGFGGVLVRGMILYLGVKIASSCSDRGANLIGMVMLVALLAMTVRGLFV